MTFRPIHPDVHTLYTLEGLKDLEEFFLNWLEDKNRDLKDELIKARAYAVDLLPVDESALILKLAPYLEDFLAHFFSIEKDVQSLQRSQNELAPLYTIQRKFVQRVALKKHKEVTQEQAANAKEMLDRRLGKNNWNELEFALAADKWLDEDDKEIIEMASLYAAWRTLFSDQPTVLFKTPKKIDFQNLLSLEELSVNGLKVKSGKPQHFRHRAGFSLTDSGLSREQALSEANYCIWCHHRQKDSCSHGIVNSKDESSRFEQNDLGITLAGCPLEEKISEMNELRSLGYSIGALATIVIDNPMVAGTGHRICNDCMKSCIYQKQEPVNIPGVETQTLNEVLDLPWGFEIYSLLTRWNPLNFTRPLPKDSSGRTALVVGMGPAGYTLAHHLMNEGHGVVAIDGLKIEPLPEDLAGPSFKIVPSTQGLYEDLNDRVLAGFGGVAEYGITVRWNKNYLKLIRLLLERRSSFALFGGVRFGGTLTAEQAFDMGIDHIALAMGAGSPTMIDVENNLAIGVRKASDFLMSLQLTGAAKAESLTNLQVRLPAIVIGGGLTGIDTATEIMAYYPVQVKKFKDRYETLVKEKGEETVRQEWTSQDLEIADEFLSHAKAFENHPDPIALMREWGGVTLAYRGPLEAAPSYRLNHEEVEKAFEEGIFFLENALPQSILSDEHGHTIGIKITKEGRSYELPARSVFVAAGTKPNTNLKNDMPGELSFEGHYFQAVDEDGRVVSPDRVAKPKQVYVLMSPYKEGRSLSFFGDLHPSFAGNVVKAMGSAKQGYPIVSKALLKHPPKGEWHQIKKTLAEKLTAQVFGLRRLTPTIVEVTIKAPLAAANFSPGQFYRLQNYEAYAPHQRGIPLVMEGLALTGAKVDKDAGLVSTIVLEMGGSSDLCQFLKEGEPVVLMGPTGEATHVPSGETVLLLGGGLGNAVLFSIGQAMRQKGCKVLYVAGYKALKDRYKVEEIEAAADQVIWCCDEGPGFLPTRPQDLTFTGNIIEGMVAFAEGRLGVPLIDFKKIDRILAIGSDGMMAAVAQARQTVLKPYLKADHTALGSINSPMQCMMKGICAQCLQQHIDPVTGEKVTVYSCVNQDQNLDYVDFKFLRKRLEQNRVQEVLTKQWIRYLIKDSGI